VRPVRAFFKVRGEMIIFAKQGEMYRNKENRGKIRNLWLMTKKRSAEILADENRKGKILKIFQSLKICRK